MSRKVLVLGGTDFVGPAVVSAACAHGDDVTIFHRGQTGSAPEGVRVMHGDRTQPSDLDAVASEQWDLVVDAWSRAPRVVLESARRLEATSARYVYISTISVYQDVHEGPLNETAPVVDASPDADATDYAADKRGAELAIESVFGPDRCVFARPGLILGPRENIGRLPWWLRRINAGGTVLAPGPADNGLQFIDARDLAEFALNTTLNGAVNVLSIPGFTTMAEVLDLCKKATGSEATFTWVDAEFLLAEKVEPWTELPIWVPDIGEWSGFYMTDSSLAQRSGLTCRPVRDTVFDTWAWLRDNPEWTQVVTGNRVRVGLAPERETALLAAWANQPPAAR
ncbi:MAG TPA: NAD-dependent epimerase/dehydratase family protein [Candidatus Acidoferrales bacterium]|nr:NAD-dependent epimerase/dehydratase family protein [Candidatus Acidoferrales bacterium]